jgi:hypothetical protein
MMARLTKSQALLVCLLASACDPAPFVCRGDENAGLVPAAEVCAHVLAVGCFVDQDPLTAGFTNTSCEAGYVEVEAQLSEAEMARLTRCYLAAETCEQLEGCNRACGEGGGSVHYDAGDGVFPDAGPSAPDAAPSDPDAGPSAPDAGLTPGG